MKILSIGFGILLLFISCKIQSGTESPHDNEHNSYKLRLNPPSGSRFHYEATSETNVEMEVDGREEENINKTNFGVSYTFEKDSSGNYLMQQDYDKLQVYTRHGETENRMDAANAAQSINPVEKMLGHLLEAKVTAVVSPKGEVKEVRGYKELGDKILEGFAPGDVQGKAQAQSQWDKMIGHGLIKKNLDQFFTMFPDSTVRVGDKWKLQSDHSGEFNVQATTFYKLKAINDDIALIESEGEVTTEGGPASAGPQAAAHLNGRLQGEYSMDTKTGMLISCTIITKLEGAIQAMGWEIPVVIENKVKLKGKQVK